MDKKLEDMTPEELQKEYRAAVIDEEYIGTDEENDSAFDRRARVEIVLLRRLRRERAMTEKTTWWFGSSRGHGLARYIANDILAAAAEAEGKEEK